VEHAPRESAGPETADPAAAPRLPASASLDPSGLDLLGAWDAGSRQRAIGALQQRHGNGWVGRRLARRKLDTGVYAYDRTKFKEQRYDGEVDPVKGTITVVLRVRYVTDGPSFASMGIAADEVTRLVDRFKQDFPAAVKAVWEDRWAIRPSLPVDAHFTYHPKVRIVEDDGNPHTEITVMWPKAGFASNVERHRDTSSGIMKSTLTVDDTKPTSKEWVKVKPPPGKLPAESDKVPFSQVVAAHEFGHMVDVRHINEDRKSGPDPYGGTYEQANDIMGYGNAVSRADCKPWFEIGAAYAAERLPGMTVTWSAVEPTW
jgi:hypothetical protein